MADIWKEPWKYTGSEHRKYQLKKDLSQLRTRRDYWAKRNKNTKTYRETVTKISKLEKELKSGDFKKGPEFERRKESHLKYYVQPAIEEGEPVPDDVMAEFCEFLDDSNPKTFYNYDKANKKCVIWKKKKRGM